MILVFRKRSKRCYCRTQLVSGFRSFRPRELSVQRSLLNLDRATLGYPICEHISQCFLNWIDGFKVQKATALNDLLNCFGQG